MSPFKSKQMNQGFPLPQLHNSIAIKKCECFEVGSQSMLIFGSSSKLDITKSWSDVLVLHLLSGIDQVEVKCDGDANGITVFSLPTCLAVSKDTDMLL